MTLWQAHLHLPPPGDATDWLIGMEGLGLPCMADEVVWQMMSLAPGSNICLNTCLNIVVSMQLLPSQQLAANIAHSWASLMTERPWVAEQSC